MYIFVPKFICMFTHKTDPVVFLKMPSSIWSCDESDFLSLRRIYKIATIDLSPHSDLHSVLAWSASIGLTDPVNVHVSEKAKKDVRGGGRTISLPTFGISNKCIFYINAVNFVTILPFYIICMYINIHSNAKMILYE